MEGEVIAPQRVSPKPKDFSRVLGAVHEGASIIRQAPGALFRKFAPWEKVPFVSEIVKTNIERVGTNALVSFHHDLYVGARSESNKDRERDRQAYIEIFGKDPLSFSSDMAAEEIVPNFQNVEYLNRGWNSLVLKFSTKSDSSSTSKPKDWVIKVGYKYSPDGEFFIHPSDPSHAVQLDSDINNLKQATQLEELGQEESQAITPEERQLREASGKFDLPHLLPRVSVPKHIRFKDYKGREVERSVMVMSYEQIYSLKDVRHAVRSSPVMQKHLVEELRRFSELRKWMCREKNKDIDLTGADNVVVVYDPNTNEGEPKLHIRLLDLGLRDHQKIAPLGHGQFDIMGLVNGVALRRAIYGRYGREFLTEDRKSELEIINAGRDARKIHRLDLQRIWWRALLEKFNLSRLAVKRDEVLNEE